MENVNRYNQPSESYQESMYDMYNFHLHETVGYPLPPVEPTNERPTRRTRHVVHPDEQAAVDQARADLQRVFDGY